MMYIGIVFNIILKALFLIKLFGYTHSIKLEIHFGLNIPFIVYFSICPLFSFSSDFFLKKYFFALPFLIVRSLVVQMVKNLLIMQETCVHSLGWEEPLEEGMATHSSTLAWRIPMDRGAWRATVHGITECQTRLSN